MARIAWDATGERFYETGVDRGVFYPMGADGTYSGGVPWNGLVSVTESPSGAESNPQYADNIKYLDLRSAEEFGATVEAYTYPDEMAEADGTSEPVEGVYFGQQPRKSFGFSFRTKVGNDTEGQDHAYKLHLIYGCKAGVSERAYTTINESPEAATFSWELTTDPVGVEGHNPVASLIVDSRKVDATKMKALEDLLYGGETEEATLPLPSAVVTLLTA